MIEKVTVNNIRCDVCSCHLEEGDNYLRVFQKDICAECIENIVKKLESDRILSLVEFDGIIDDIIHNI